MACDPRGHRRRGAVADRRAVRRSDLGAADLLGHLHSARPAAVLPCARAVAQHLPARRRQPDRARLSLQPRPHAAQAARRARLPDPGRDALRSHSCTARPLQHQRARRRSAAARRRRARVLRRHRAQRQERLVLDVLPAAARAADLRPDAVCDRPQQPLRAVSRLREELLRLQPAGCAVRRSLRRQPRPACVPQALRRRLPRARARVLHRRQPRRPAHVRAVRHSRASERGPLPVSRQRRADLDGDDPDALRSGCAQRLLLVLVPAARTAARARPAGLVGVGLAQRHRRPLADLGRVDPAQRGALPRGRLVRGRRPARSRSRERSARLGGGGRRDGAATAAADRGRRGSDSARGDREGRPVDRSGVPHGHVRSRPDLRARRRGLALADRRRRALDARAARTRRLDADGVLRPRPRSRLDLAHAGAAHRGCGRRARRGRRARDRAGRHRRQRHRRHDGGRLRAPPPRDVQHRPGRARGALPLQPHGDLPARVRTLGDAARPGFRRSTG